jgi:hypothetical protein
MGILVAYLKLSHDFELVYKEEDFKMLTDLLRQLLDMGNNSHTYIYNFLI